VDYHGASYLDHLAIAEEEGLSVDEVDSRRLAVDVDEPEDLAELLLHGEGAARDWLVDAGFELATGGGRVTATRDSV
jgi:2-phospho-L-lactate guanylyltransferase